MLSHAFSLSLSPSVLRSSYHEDVLNLTVSSQTGIAPSRPASAGGTSRGFTKYLHVLNTSFDQPFLGPIHIPAHVKFTCYSNLIQLFGVTPSFLGEISRFHCQEIIVPCTPFQANTSLNILQAPQGTTCAPYYQVPDVLGTLPQQDIYWLCGHFLYLGLPANWAGRCAPVVADRHSYVVTAINIQHHLCPSRLRRSPADPHDPMSIYIESQSVFGMTGEIV